MQDQDEKKRGKFISFLVEKCVCQYKYNIEEQDLTTLLTTHVSKHTK